MATNARDIYNFRNKIINDIKKEIGEETREDGKNKELRLHRSEEELIDLIKDVGNDDDLDKDNNIKSRKNNLLEFLNSIKNKKINDEINAKCNYFKFLNYKESLGRTQNGSRADRIKSFINGAEYIIFGPLFNPKFDTAKAEQDDTRELVTKSIPKMDDKNKPPTTGHGLKIMTPNQLITRLPILLAQKQAGNNRQKLNNEIRQIIYSLYRSKNLPKAIYNHLINSL